MREERDCCQQEQAAGPRIIPRHVGNSTPPCSAWMTRADHSQTWGTVRGHFSQPGVWIIPTRVGNRTVLAGQLKRAHGSSPHAWGTAPGDDLAVLLRRIIPTRVGNQQNQRLLNRYIPAPARNRSTASLHDGFQRSRPNRRRQRKGRTSNRMGHVRILPTRTWPPHFGAQRQVSRFEV